MSDEARTEGLGAVVQKATEIVSDCPPQRAALPPKQLRGIELLVSGWSLLKVAEELEITPRTLFRWRKDPGFAEEYECQRSALRQAVGERLIGLADAALQALSEVLEKGDSESARVAAARTVLDRLNAPVWTEPKLPEPEAREWRDPAERVRAREEELQQSMDYVLGRMAEFDDQRRRRREAERTAERREVFEVPEEGGR